MDRALALFASLELLELPVPCLLGVGVKQLVHVLLRNMFGVHNLSRICAGSVSDILDYLSSEASEAGTFPSLLRPSMSSLP